MRSAAARDSHALGSSLLAAQLGSLSAIEAAAAVVLDTLPLLLLMMQHMNTSWTRSGSRRPGTLAQVGGSGSTSSSMAVLAACCCMDVRWLLPAMRPHCIAAAAAAGAASGGSSRMESGFQIIANGVNIGEQHCFAAWLSAVTTAAGAVLCESSCLAALAAQRSRHPHMHPLPAVVLPHAMLPCIMYIHTYPYIYNTYP